jgi:hypothetical protein
MVGSDVGDLKIGDGILGDSVMKEGGGFHSERREFHGQVTVSMGLKA